MPSAGVDVRLARALSHPLRQRILAALGARVASPSDLAAELGEPLGDVAYHVKRLVDHECVDLVRTERRRGAVKHLYTARRWLGTGEEEWQALSVAERQDLAGRLVGQLVLDARTAEVSGRLAETGVHLSRTPLELDERAVEELNTILREVVERALRVQAQSRARQSEGDRAAPARRELAIMHFGAV